MAVNGNRKLTSWRRAVVSIQLPPTGDTPLASVVRPPGLVHRRRFLGGGAAVTGEIHWYTPQ